jgi:hypothetical protein
LNAANFRTGARNFVNSWQGYQTVKTASIRRLRQFEISIRVLCGPLRSTNANSAAACDGCRRTQPCDGPRAVKTGVAGGGGQIAVNPNPAGGGSGERRHHDQTIAMRRLIPGR